MSRHADPVLKPGAFDPIPPQANNNNNNNSSSTTNAAQQNMDVCLNSLDQLRADAQVFFQHQQLRQGGGAGDTEQQQQQQPAVPVDYQALQDRLAAMERAVALQQQIHQQLMMQQQQSQQHQLSYAAAPFVPPAPATQPMPARSHFSPTQPSAFGAAAAPLQAPRTPTNGSSRSSNNSSPAAAGSAGSGGALLNLSSGGRSSGGGGGRHSGATTDADRQSAVIRLRQGSQTALNFDALLADVERDHEFVMRSAEQQRRREAAAAAAAMQAQQQSGGASSGSALAGSGTLPSGALLGSGSGTMGGTSTSLSGGGGNSNSNNMMMYSVHGTTQHPGVSLRGRNGDLDASDASFTATPIRRPGGANGTAKASSSAHNSPAAARAGGSRDASAPHTPAGLHGVAAAAHHNYSSTSPAAAPSADGTPYGRVHVVYDDNLRPMPRDAVPASLRNINGYQPTSVLVEFKRQRVLQYESDMYVAPGEHVVVGGDRGEDIGLVTYSWSAHGGGPGAAPPTPQKAREQGVGKVLRVASHMEISQLQGVQAELEKRAREVAQLKVAEHALPMTIVDAEYQFDRKKLTFFYSSQHRLDFRVLVRDLYKTFRARIWMELV